MDRAAAYRRAADHLPAGQIHLRDDPLPRQKTAEAHLHARACAHTRAHARACAHARVHGEGAPEIRDRTWRMT
ncbi:hypothetical protein GCM10009560_27900 [Nonomuraea longicatena]|uniref:Uncharacterized protein n=1 Tax=Nonomuraea longicatena TaxID=83682 RepID=A0ABN1PCF8_9ACTN